MTITYYAHDKKEPITIEAKLAHWNDTYMQVVNRSVCETLANVITNKGGIEDYAVIVRKTYKPESQMVTVLVNRLLCK